MKEHLDLVRAWRALPDAEEAVLATVVATKGSVYRRPGARMLIARDHWLAGSVSGGCVESELMEYAFDRTIDGPAVCRYDSTSPDDILYGFGLGCQGVVDVLLQRLPDDGGALRLIDEVIQTRTSAWLHTDLGTGLTTAHSDRPAEDGFVERVEPPHALIVFGAGHDAIPLARMAGELGWHVTVVDPRLSYAVAERFPSVDRLIVSRPETPMEIESDASVVVMTHHFASDAAILRWVRAPYIGVIGPRTRTDQLLTESHRRREEVRSPIGLDIGSQGPEQIALAILAEILAFRTSRPGTPLNDRPALR